jgi:hypothetical protein
MATSKMATAADARSGAEDINNEMRAQIERLDGELRDFVKERPIMALLGAVAAGYVVGRVMRRLA